MSPLIAAHFLKSWNHTEHSHDHDHDQPIQSGHIFHLDPPCQLWGYQLKHITNVIDSPLL
jgi:hypothetical protein